MNTSRTCRAKDPATCRVHGTTPGQSAYDKIRSVLNENKKSYFISKAERKERPLKTLNPVGLTLALLDYVRENNMNEDKVKEAIDLAAELHIPDTRSGRGYLAVTPYIEHPLRNTVRATRYGVKDQSILIGSLLHDVVEDHPFELSTKAGVVTDDEFMARTVSLDYISSKFGTDVSRMVEGMSNPIQTKTEKFAPAEMKNKVYAHHVSAAIKDNRVLVGKVCDFVDNAVGLIHNKDSMNHVGLQKRATKYLPVCDIIEARLVEAKSDPDFYISPDKVDVIISQIKSGRRNLASIILDSKNIAKNSTNSQF